MHDLDENYCLYLKDHLNNSLVYEYSHNKMTKFIREKDGTYKIKEEIEVIYSRAN